MDLTWWAGLALAVYLVRWLYSMFQGMRAQDDLHGAATGRKRNRKKQSAPPAAPAPESAPAAAQGTKERKEGKKAGAAGDGAAKPQPKGKTLTLRHGKDAPLRAAVADALSGERRADPDAFETVVSKSTRGIQKQQAKMAEQERAALGRIREVQTDAKWDHLPFQAEELRKEDPRKANAYKVLDHEAKGPAKVGISVPQKKQPRAATAQPPSARFGAVPTQPTAAMLQEMERVRNAARPAPPSVATVLTKVKVQGQWYGLTGEDGLLGVGGFAHAPQLMECYVQDPSSAQGGLFINIDGKEWCGERCADDLSWLVEWVPPLVRLLSQEATDAEARVYWGGEGKDPAVRMVLHPPALQMTHVRTQGLSVVPVRADAAAFATSVLEQFEALSAFTARLLQCAEEKEQSCAEAKKQGGRKGERAERQLAALATVRQKLPQPGRLSGLREALEEALSVYRAADSKPAGA
eukprot:TRINITY_DN9065_c0_g1_i1.p1 TRINITY_DN9065_c0_g1~~TRINITY_DN9065_c0_g1_i1.p1  ORF type:complete len:498 (+),score=181.52 TRINITY_DN9065_c0_g1_i1:102-1496(+)